VRLTVSDGGANDADGQVNGTVLDPGGVAALQSVVVTTNGSGNAGGGGAIDALMLCFGLGVLSLRFRRRWSEARAAAAVVLCVALLVAASAPAFAQGSATGWYAGVRFGRAYGSVSEGDLNSRLSAAGYDVLARYDDRVRTAWSVRAGYWFLPYAGVQAAYTDLGDVGATISGTVPDVEAFLSEVAKLHPRSATGGEFALVARYPLMAKLALTGKAGLLLWNSSYRIAASDGGDARVTDSGTGAVVGAAFEYSPGEHWGFALDWTRYRVQSETIPLLGVCADYRW
jgi:Outer membrane protein beta-barrel domain